VKKSIKYCSNYLCLQNQHTLDGLENGLFSEPEKQIRDFSAKDMNKLPLFVSFYLIYLITQIVMQEIMAVP
jgi:hypothetical protein